MDVSCDESRDEFTKSLICVKDFVDAGVKELPRFYVRDPGLLQSRSQVSNVPVIDLQGVISSLEKRAEAVKKIHDACEEWGFFQIINHGIPPSIIGNMLEALDEFFNLPFEEQKELYSNDPMKETRYGTSYRSLETCLEWRDYLRHPCLPLEQWMPTWPSKPSSYKPAAIAYCQAIKHLGDTLLELLSEAMGLETGFLANLHGEKLNQVMLSNYYPPCPNPELAIGVTEHTDFGGFTILYQSDVEGLEFFHNGEWVLVHPSKDSFVFNIGDYLEIISNGRYRSVLHRGKVNAEKLRISIPTFFYPSRHAYTGPLPELLSLWKEEAAYKSNMNFGEFFDMCLSTLKTCPYQLNSKPRRMSMKI